MHSFPEGTFIARIAWTYLPSDENNKTFGRPQSFVAGPPKNGVQFMIKDSTKYASKGGWGHGHFEDGKPAAAAILNSCFPWHQAIKSRDFPVTHLNTQKRNTRLAPRAMTGASWRGHRRHPATTREEGLF